MFVNSSCIWRREVSSSRLKPANWIQFSSLCCSQICFMLQTLQLSRAGLRLQGKQLLPTNHPSLLETGFSPPPPSLFSPPHAPPPSSVLLLLQSTCLAALFCDCSYFSAARTQERGRGGEHVFLKLAGKQCETEQHVLVIPPHCRQVLASCDCLPVRTTLQ